MKLQQFEARIHEDLEPVEICLRHAQVTRCYCQRKEDKVTYLIDAQGKASRYDHETGKFVPDHKYDLKTE